MKWGSRALTIALGLGLLALWTNARADDPPNPSEVGKPRAAKEGMQDWPWYFEIAQPKAAESDSFDFLVPPAMFDKANESLTDLRLRDAKDQEIPYALFVRRTTTKSEDVRVKQFNPTTDPDHSVSVTLEVEGEGRKHNEIVIVTSGQDFRRRVQVESSEDNKTWNALLKDELIFFKAGTQLVDVHKFSYAENRRRYLRVTVHPDPGKKDDKPVIQGVTVNESAEEKGEDVTLPVELGPRQPTRLDGVYGSSWMLDLNKRVPVERILVDVSDPVFERAYRVEQTPEQQTAPLDKWTTPFPFVTGGVWNRGPDLPRGPLEIRFPEIFVRQLRLTVADSNNPPLTITRVQYQAPARQVIFANSAETAWPVRVYCGNPTANDPAYDLKNLVSPRLKPAPVRLEITPGEATPNPIYQAPPVPWSERHPWLVYFVLAIASVVLFGILALLGKQALLRTPPVAQPTLSSSPQPHE